MSGLVRNEKESKTFEREDSLLPIAQLLGLHPVVSVMMVAIDVMLTALDMTIVLWPVSCLVAAALAYPCYAMQKSAFGDKHDVALAKAIFVAILTAIPTPLPDFLTLGAGALGAARVIFGKKKKGEKRVQESVDAVPTVWEVVEPEECSGGGSGAMPVWEESKDWRRGGK